MAPMPTAIPTTGGCPRIRRAFPSRSRPRALAPAEARPGRDRMSASPDARAVDVILPTYRRPHTIAYAIRSVLAQTHRDFTLHVVGDGCSAETEAVVDGIQDPRIRFHLFPKAMGFGYAHRND